MAETRYDVIVIGEGVSGLTVAGKLAAAGLRVATLEANLFGGLVINVNELDPVPEGRPHSGAELASELMQANAEGGVASIQEPVTSLDASGPIKKVVTASGTYAAPSVVIASGARAKRLGVPGEQEFEGRGVSQCADCDGPMYQNEEVIVVGGGDSALQEALVLAQYCKRVHLVHRGNSFRGSEHFQRSVKANDRISVMWNTTVEAVEGGKMVEKVRVKREGKTDELPCAGLFAYIGLDPNTDFARSAVKCDADGFITTSDAFETSASGVYAIGAVRSGFGGTLADSIREAEQVAKKLSQQLG